MQKAKIKWQCRRGMLELDLILSRFIDSELEKLSQNELDILEKVLAAPDPELYSWLLGESIPMDKELHHIVEYIQLHYTPR